MVIFENEIDKNFEGKKVQLVRILRKNRKRNCTEWDIWQKVFEGKNIFENENLELLKSFWKIGLFDRNVDLLGF